MAVVLTALTTTCSFQQLGRPHFLACCLVGLAVFMKLVRCQAVEDDNRTGERTL